MLVKACPRVVGPFNAGLQQSTRFDNLDIAAANFLVAAAFFVSGLPRGDTQRQTRGNVAVVKGS